MHGAPDLTPRKTDTKPLSTTQIHFNESQERQCHHVVERLSLCFYPLLPVCPLPSEPHAKAHCNRNENYSSADLQIETTLDYLATPHARFHWSRWGVWGENRTDGRKMEKWSPSRQCLWLWSRNLKRNPSTLDQVQPAADQQNSSNEIAYGSHTVILIYCSAKANARSECVAVCLTVYSGSPLKKHVQGLTKKIAYYWQEAALCWVTSVTDLCFQELIFPSKLNV